MGINIAGGADITVTKPLLNFFQAYAIGVKQAGAAMAQIVETDALHLMCYQKIREMLAQKVGANTPPHRVHINIVEIVRAVVFHLIEHLLTGRNKGKCPTTGLRFGSITSDFGHNTINLCGNDCMLDTDCFVLKIDCVPFQTNNLTAAQSIERSHDDTKF